MNVPVVSHLKLLVNLYNKMNNRFLVLLVIYLIIYLLSVLYKNKQIFCAILLSLLSWERGLKFWNTGEVITTRLSLLSWERGLKCACCRFRAAAGLVAPLVGAWIEISFAPAIADVFAVAPLVGAWIEILSVNSNAFPFFVAPLVGAWIEILFLCHNLGIRRVAPLVGAWIEMA